MACPRYPGQSNVLHLLSKPVKLIHLGLNKLAALLHGRFKNHYDIWNIRALKFSMYNQDKGFLLNSTQNILPIHWMIWFLCNVENLKLLNLNLYHSLHDNLGRFKNTCELLNARALKISTLDKIHIFHSVGKIFCAEFQRESLKFRTKNLKHTLKDMHFIQMLRFENS